MSGKQIPFFATTTDLIEVCREIVDELGVKFVECGLFDNPNMVEIFDPSLLREQTGYMVLDAEIILKSRPVEQRKGGVRYAFDPGSNGGHTLIRTGGESNASMLLPGDVALMANAPPDAKRIFSAFDNKLKKSFEKIKTYRVGPEAAALLDKGGRLALAPKSPPEYDLKRQ
jgi:hypothetical protein